MLGRVLGHRDSYLKGVPDTDFHLSEARQLHRTLVSLSLHLTWRGYPFVDNGNATAAFALCYAARFVLYTMYACNEHYSDVGPRIPEETEMQQISINGLKEVTLDIYQLSRQILAASTTMNNLLLSKSFLLCHCLYQAATEFAWFVREDKTIEQVTCLRSVVELLGAIKSRWRVAGRDIFANPLLA